MSKILMYVDAENVGRNQVEAAVKEAKELAHEHSSMFIGKFYGANLSLGSLIKQYTKLGLEYVDTSVYSDNKKNLTDMKIIVDSTWDILGVYKNDVQMIYILSNDCDFNPLLCKFKSLSVDVRCATYDNVGELTNMYDLTQFLKISGVSPLKKEFALDSLYDVVYKVAGGVLLDDSIVLTYVRIRLDKLARSTFERFNLVLDLDTEAKLKQFNFKVFDEVLQEAGHLNRIANFNFYASRVFGSTLKRYELESLQMFKEG